jgi:hypothetical protein
MATSSNTDRLPPLDSLPGVVSGGLRRLAFWLAVLLPFVQLSLLLSGLDSRATAVSFGLLLGLNILALVAGHPGHPPD